MELDRDGRRAQVTGDLGVRPEPARGDDRDPHLGRDLADRRVGFGVTEEKGNLKFLVQTSGDAGCIANRLDVLRNDDELVSAESAHGVAEREQPEMVALRLGGKPHDEGGGHEPFQVGGRAGLGARAGGNEGQKAQGGEEAAGIHASRYGGSGTVAKRERDPASEGPGAGVGGHPRDCWQR